MATADVVDTLYANVTHNLVDTTRHADVAAWGSRVVISPVPIMAGLPQPYLELVPDSWLYGPDAGNAREILIAVYIVAASFNTPTSEGLFKKYSSGDPYGALARAVREALVRPHPYSDGTHITGVGTYATQNQVITCWPERLGPVIRMPMAPGDAEEADPDFHLGRPLLLHYSVVES